MQDEHLEHLISGHLHGLLTAQERAELERRLLHSAADRAMFWAAAEMHAMLHAQLQTDLGAELPEGAGALLVEAGPGFGKGAGAALPGPAVVSGAGRRGWRPLTAAAAGLVLGLFSASLVFGYVMPSLQTRVLVFQDGFEAGMPPAVEGGQPLRPGRWGGDFTEVTGAVDGVKPAEGGRMLRFLRADYEGRHLPESFSSDSFQLLDLRPFKKEFGAGTAVVRLSAVFNAGPGAGEGPFSGVLKLYALDAALVEERAAGLFTGSITERMLANSSSSRVRLDAEPGRWQRAGAELRVPPDTDYLMIQVGVTNERQGGRGGKDAFAAHFVDGVQVVLAHVPEVGSP